jgi:hypothetical protein
METTMRNSGIEDEAAFLQKAFATGTALAEMVSVKRKNVKRKT